MYNWANNSENFTGIHTDFNFSVYSFSLTSNAIWICRRNQQSCFFFKSSDYRRNTSCVQTLFPFIFHMNWSKKENVIIMKINWIYWLGWVNLFFFSNLLTWGTVQQVRLFLTNSWRWQIMLDFQKPNSPYIHQIYLYSFEHCWSCLTVSIFAT